MITSRLIMISVLLAVITTSSSVVDALPYELIAMDAGRMKPNVPYYIRLMEYDPWICMMNPTSTTNLEGCPLQPMMFNKPTIVPTPVMFVLPSSNNDTYLHESTKYSIKFVNQTKCDQCNVSGFWRVSSGEVILGGAAGREDSMFRVESTDSYYQFTIGESVYPNVYATSISLTNTGYKDRLLAKPQSMPMEVNFYQFYPPEW